MSDNSKAKRKLILKYGKKCFIEALGLRTKEEINQELKLYGKKQRKIMDELTYHHILEKCKGGKSTVENGAILRNINHQWFNRLSSEQQKQINQLFQEYKRKLDNKEKFQICVSQLTTKGVKKTKKITVDIKEYISIPLEDFTPEEFKIYQEHKQKRNERVFKKFENIER